MIGGIFKPTGAVVMEAHQRQNLDFRDSVCFQIEFHGSVKADIQCSCKGDGIKKRTIFRQPQIWDSVLCAKLVMQLEKTSPALLVPVLHVIKHRASIRKGETFGAGFAA
jgi:hypothetical protein